MSNKPILKNKYVTVWPPGEYGHSIVIEKSYKDKKTQEWKRTNKFFENELPTLLEAVKEAIQALANSSENDEALQNITNAFDDQDIPY